MHEEVTAWIMTVEGGREVSDSAGEGGLYSGTAGKMEESQCLYSGTAGKTMVPE